MNALKPMPLVEALQSSDRSDGGISIADIWAFIQARRAVILGTAALVMAVAFVMVSRMTPLYTATSTVLIDTQRKRVSNVEEVMSGLSADMTSLQNQLAIIESPRVAARVVEKLGLGVPPAGGDRVADEFSLLKPSSWLGSSSDAVEGARADSTLPSAEAEALRREEYKERMTNMVLGGLSAQVVGRSSVIAVTYTSPDPEMSARIANAIADAYLIDQLETKFEASQRATSWLSEQVDKLAQQLKAAESAVERYRADNGLSPVEGDPVIDRQIGELGSQLTAAKAKRAETEARYNQAVRGGGAVTAVVQSSLIPQLRAQEADISRKISELSDRYQPRHPELVRANAELASVRAKIQEEIGRIVGSLKAEYAAAQALEASLQERLAELEGTATEQRQTSVGLRELEREAQSTRALYEAMLARLKETKGLSDMDLPDARILSTAEVPLAASAPRTKLILAAAVPVAVLLGFLAAFIVNSLDNGFRSEQLLEQVTGMAVLGAIPEAKRRALGGSRPGDLIVEKPLSEFAEGLRTVRTGLSLSNVDNPPRLILVTSSVPGEGKTTLALGLARLIARGGSTVALVDLDLRHASVLQAAGVTKPGAGIVEVLSSRSSLDEALVKDPKSSVALLGLKERAISPPDLIVSASMRQLLKTLREKYEYVIVDSAPVLPVTDTKLIVREMDAVVMAVRWEKTSRAAANKALAELRVVGAQISGLALTRVNSRRNAIYAYGDASYSQYAKYYQS